MRSRLHALSERALVAFVRWFESGGGVWQTTGVVLVVVGVELSDRSLDPHAFLLMAVLTVYSAVTQPALAFSNAMAAGVADEMIRRQIVLEEQLIAMEHAHGEQLSAHGRLLEAIAARLEIDVAGEVR